MCVCAFVDLCLCCLVKGVCLTYSCAFFSISLDMSLFERSVFSFLKSYPHLHARLPGPLRRQPRLVAVENPCASAHWSGVCGCFANPTANTGDELNFYRYMNEEHRPINLPDNHRSFQCRDDGTIISAGEDPEVPYSGASSSSKQTAVSRVPHHVRIFRCEPLETAA